MQLIEKYAVKNNVVVNRKTASGNFFPKYESALSKDQLLSLIGTKKKESCEEKTASGRCVYANGDPINFVDPTGRADEILVGIGGTKSRISIEFIDSNGTTNSHVNNMVNSFNGEKEFFDGPNHFLETISVHNQVIDYISKQVRINPNVIINVAGGSRGGHIGVGVAVQLDERGVILDNGLIVYPRIQFLGLYDPVDMTPSYGPWSETIPSNVDHVAIAYSNPNVESRSYFNRVNGGVEDPSLTNYNEKFFFATHGGILGDPWGGDHPLSLSTLINEWSFMNEEIDRAGSIHANYWMLQQAASAGLILDNNKFFLNNATTITNPIGKCNNP